MDDQLRFLLAIVERLDRAAIPYMVTGSTAMAAYATPRMTRDLDLVVDIGHGDIDSVVALFEPDCLIDRASVVRAVEQQGMFNIIHQEWVVKADFVVRKDEPYRVEEFARRRIIEIEGRRVAIVAPEDLVLSKLVWSKESRSALQEEDVRTMLQSVGDLDIEYMRKWASRLEVNKALERLSQ